MSDNKRRKTRVPGIIERNGYYHLRKTHHGIAIRGSTGIPVERGRLTDAETVLLHRMEQVRQVKLLGQTPEISFADAAVEYVARNQHKATNDWFANQCARLSDHYLGSVPVADIYQEHPQIQKLIQDLREGTVPWDTGRGHGTKVPKPRKKKTILAYIEVVVRVLNFCANSWRDESTNQHYLKSVPKFDLDFVPDDARPPVAMTWPEQREMEKHLPSHLQRMMLYDLNSGLRDFEITNLRWQWRQEFQGIDLFVIPGWHEEFDDDGKLLRRTKITKNKNGKPRVSIINSVCASILKEQKGLHPEFVFPYEGGRITRVVNSAWTRARTRAAKKHKRLHDLHFHDCRHTFGHRLETAGVDKRAQRTLLGHTSSDITDRYTQQDLKHLQACAELVTQQTESVPILMLT